MVNQVLNKGFCLAIILCLVISGLVKAQDTTAIDSLESTAAAYFDEANEQEALETYLKVLEKDPDHYEALWRTALLYARIGFRMDSEQQKEDHYYNSLKYAERTLGVYPDSGHTHFVYAVAQGRISDISGTSMRIKKSHIVKEHGEKALEMLPDYAPAWHLMGLWHSKVANLSTVQRFAAGIFSKGLPEGASNEKAEEYIKKALELEPEGHIRLKLDLARHYERSGQEQKAIDTLKEVVQETPRNEIQEWNMEQAKQLLEELT